ncbi:TraQ conjugal transfer family protein [Aureivirga marina]|uniref:TraQ conjugal transfer family protein n=1 Tax=Aureivirga marina TaxID=1182451 RepID=UPI0018CB031A|nr:TraQ conjugal transfer family protein [Aureivirga marina]
MRKYMIYLVLSVLFLMSCNSDDENPNFSITASYYQNIIVNTDTEIEVLIIPVENSIDSVYYYSYQLNGAGQVRIKDGDELQPGDEFETERLTSAFIFTPTQLGANYLNFTIHNNNSSREFEIFYDVIAE